ncbi:MAG: hypothetical protein HQ567_06965 [Candidatus Nealsonbacteria bacterium]|nr:hypothetical protein [Candidatus Nealsonbacteria bacterium]
MAERLVAQIWIGGRLSANRADELCGAISAEYVSLEFGDGQFCPNNPQDLLQARVEHHDSRVLRLCDDQASWGEFADLESFLQEHAIPYTRQSEAGGGYNGEIVEHRPPDDPICIPIDANGSPTVDVDAMRRVAKAIDIALRRLDAGEVCKAVLRLKRARQSLCRRLPPDIPPLPSFEIEGYQPPEENHGQ